MNGKLSVRQHILDGAHGHKRRLRHTLFCISYSQKWLTQPLVILYIKSNSTTTQPNLNPQRPHHTYPPHITNLSTYPPTTHLNPDPHLYKYCPPNPYRSSPHRSITTTDATPDPHLTYCIGVVVNKLRFQGLTINI